MLDVVDTTVMPNVGGHHGERGEKSAVSQDQIGSDNLLIRGAPFG